MPKDWINPSGTTRKDTITVDHYEQRRGTYTFSDEEYEKLADSLSFLSIADNALRSAGISGVRVREWTIKLVKQEVPQTDVDGNVKEFKTIEEFALYVDSLRNKNTITKKGNGHARQRRT